MIMCSFSGCGLIPTVPLDDEQTEIVAEYAAGLLAKYEKGHSMGLVRVNELDMEALYATPTPTPIVTPEPLVPEEPELSYDEDISGEVQNSASEEVQITIVPLNEAFGFYNGNLDFAYVERCETYPQSEEQLLFAMNSTDGNDLMVVHFALSNQTGDEQSYLTNLKGYKVRFVVNGQDKYRCDFTILPNDLTSLSGKLSSGEMMDSILIFEVPKDKEVYSLDLLLVNGQEQMKYSLYQ